MSLSIEGSFRSANSVVTAAESWTAVAEEARLASEDEEPEPARWRALSDRTSEVLEAERRLWSDLAG